MRAEGKYVQEMRDQGWLLWRRGAEFTSFVCHALGCQETRLVSPSQIASGDMPRPCKMPHDRGFAAHVVGSHQDLQKNLRNRRLMLGLSQSDVEAAAGLAKDHVAKLEVGLRLPRFPTYIAWAETLGYDIALVPKALPDQVLAIIDQKAGRAIPGRVPPACLLLPVASQDPGRSQERANTAA